MPSTRAAVSGALVWAVGGVGVGCGRGTGVGCGREGCMHIPATAVGIDGLHPHHCTRIWHRCAARCTRIASHNFPTVLWSSALHPIALHPIALWPSAASPTALFLSTELTQKRMSYHTLRASCSRLALKTAHCKLCYCLQSTSLNDMLCKRLAAAMPHIGPSPAAPFAHSPLSSPAA